MNIFLFVALAAHFLIGLAFFTLFILLDHKEGHIDHKYIEGATLVALFWLPLFIGSTIAIIVLKCYYDYAHLIIYLAKRRSAKP